LRIGFVGLGVFMGKLQDVHRQELAQLQIELAKASRLLDQLEQRSSARAGALSASKNVDPTPENLEMRFAACVASGMSKINFDEDPKGSFDTLRPNTEIR
jgi:hypothetical protein